MKKTVCFLIISMTILCAQFTRDEYPAELYLIGEGYADNTGSADDIMLAKNRAQSDLTGQIQSNIKSEFVSEVAEKANSIKEYTSSRIKAMSDLQLEGIQWQTEKTNDLITAYAILNKKNAARFYQQKTSKLINDLNGSLLAADQFTASGRKDKALLKLIEAGRLFNQIEQNILINMVLGGRGTDLTPPISRAVLDTKITNIAAQNFNNFDDAVNGICFQIAPQISDNKKIKIFPFEYQNTAFGSSLSDYIRQKIEQGLSKFKKYKSIQSTEKPDKIDYLSISGSYWIKKNTVEIISLIYNEKGLNTGSARVNFPLSYITGLGIEYKPKNILDALSDEKLFAKNEAVHGDLKIEVWTNKGDRNLIFRANEEMKIFVRMNAPGYIRIIYHLANGARAPLYTNFYINEAKVNKPVPMPDTFVCSPPFGVERLQVFASTKEFSELPVKTVMIAGEEYEVLAEDIKTHLGKTRGMLRKKSKKRKTAERVLTITTVERR